MSMAPPPKGLPTALKEAPVAATQAEPQAEPVTEEMREWLELTGWYEDEYRTKALRRHRKLVELDRQRSELEAEARLEAEERGRMARAQSVRPPTATGGAGTPGNPFQPPMSMGPPRLPVTLGQSSTAEAAPATANGHSVKSVAPLPTSGSSKRPRSSDANDRGPAPDKQPRRSSGQAEGAPSSATLGPSRTLETRVSVPERLALRSPSPPSRRRPAYHQQPPASGYPTVRHEDSREAFVFRRGGGAPYMPSPPRGVSPPLHHHRPAGYENGYYDSPDAQHPNRTWHRGGGAAFEYDDRDDRRGREVEIVGNYRGRNYDPNYHQRPREPYGRGRGRGKVYGYRGTSLESYGRRDGPLA